MPYYFPTTYQPYQMYQQPQYQQPAQQQPQTSIIWVSGEQEAQSYPVAPNNAVALWDSNGAAIYLKQADASGKPSIKAFDLVERTQSASAGVSPAGGKDAPFATKSELDALAGSVEALKGDLAKIRKAVKRKEVEDDDE